MLNDQTVLFQINPFNVSTESNGSSHCYISLTIQLNLSRLFTELNDQTVLVQTIQFSISSQFFVYTLLNVKNVLFLTIQFSISRFCCLHTVKCKNGSILNNPV